MSPFRVRACTETVAPDVAGTSCAATELRTDPRSLSTSMCATVPSPMPTSMSPEPFISLA